MPGGRPPRPLADLGQPLDFIRKDWGDRPLEAAQAADQKHKPFDDEKSEFSGTLKLWKWIEAGRGHGDGQADHPHGHTAAGTALARGFGTIATRYAERAPRGTADFWRMAVVVVELHVTMQPNRPFRVRSSYISTTTSQITSPISLCRTSCKNGKDERGENAGQGMTTGCVGVCPMAILVTKSPIAVANACHCVVL